MDAIWLNSTKNCSGLASLLPVNLGIEGSKKGKVMSLGTSREVSLVFAILSVLDVSFPDRV